ncbi:alcohol oxidase, partial [Microthyrium microscopicum]
IDEFQKAEFDYVICGGGTAGMTLAARLSENENVTVGVLEAGKHRPNDPNVDTPGALFAMLGNPEYDWNWKSVPQKANRGIVHHIPRGKLLGGSSGTNYMMYVRGSLRDFDDWAELAGDAGWDSSHMMKYMRKHQTLEPIHDAITDRTNLAFAVENHGSDGPVRTSFNDTPSLPIEIAIIDAADEVTGYAKAKDPWSGDHIGFFNTLGSVVRSGPDKGKRSYAGRGYLNAAKGRSNLKILCEAVVNKINLEGEKATGVNFTHDGKTYDVKIKREVLVCGGVIQSPQILELSGIGDPEVLRAAGVDVKVENKAIGNNYQDHSITLMGYKLKPDVMSVDSLFKPDNMAGAMKAYAETQSGPLSSISSTQGFLSYNICVDKSEVQATVDSIKQSIKDAPTEFQKKQLQQIIIHLEDSKSANLQMVVIPASMNPDAAGDQSKIVTPDPNGPDGITLAICLQYPVSRGSIHIKSADPKDSPVIDPAYLKHSADAAVLAGGMKLFDRVTKSSKLAPMIEKRYCPEPDKDLQDLRVGEAEVYNAVFGEYHSCGSVAMGDALDSRLKVKGVKSVRVVDASIFPNNVSGNICSSVYSLAEKAADLIKEDW